MYKYKILLICICLLAFDCYSQELINVKQFGAKGDGKIDDTDAVQAALDSGMKNSLGIFFPNGTYMVSNLNINTDIIGDTQSIIKKVPNLGLEKYSFCKVNKRKDITIRNLIFDGSVETDTNGNPISGSVPLFVINSKEVKIVNCTFKNSPMSGIRVESSSDLEIVNCTVTASKGEYGDGFYFASSNSVKLQNCVAADYNRIGFVTEANSYDFLFKGCKAKDGSKASILRGGTEYNAGFWFENSANISTINCVAENNTHIGFVAVSGPKLRSVLTSGDSANFYFENCKSINNPIGYQLFSSGMTVNMLLNKCIAENSVRGFIATAKTIEDRFSFDDCRVSLRPIFKTNVNNAGFMWESPVTGEVKKYAKLPQFTYSNCYIKYIEPVDESQLFNNNNNNGDISTYSGGIAKVIVSNLKNSLKGGKVIIKARRGRPVYEISDTNADPAFIKK